jgi:hypothetical protein
MFYRPFLGEITPATLTLGELTLNDMTLYESEMTVA